MVVRVEPLRHLPRLALRRPTGERGQQLERILREPLWVDPEHERGLEDLVVQEEVVHGRADELDLLIQVGTAQLRPSGSEIISGGAARPALLEGPLQLAVRSDAWVADELCDDVQGEILCGVGAGSLGDEPISRTAQLRRRATTVSVSICQSPTGKASGRAVLSVARGGTSDWRGYSSNEISVI